MQIRCWVTICVGLFDCKFFRRCVFCDCHVSILWIWNYWMWQFFGVCVDCIFFCWYTEILTFLTQRSRITIQTLLKQLFKPLISAILVLTTVILNYCIRKILNLDSKTAVSFASGKRIFSSQIAKDFAFSEIVRNDIYLSSSGTSFAIYLSSSGTSLVLSWLMQYHLLSYR